MPRKIKRIGTAQDAVLTIIKMVMFCVNSGFSIEFITRFPKSLCVVVTDTKMLKKKKY